MCLRQSGFRIGAGDVLLGEVEGCPFYVGAAQAPCWTGCEITLDVLSNGGGDSFSLEAADGARFAVRSRLCTPADQEPEEAAATHTRRSALVEATS